MFHAKIYGKNAFYVKFLVKIKEFLGIWHTIFLNYMYTKNQNAITHFKNSILRINWFEF